MIKDLTGYKILISLQIFHLRAFSKNETKDKLN